MNQQLLNSSGRQNAEVTNQSFITRLNELKFETIIFQVDNLKMRALNGYLLNKGTDLRAHFSKAF